MSDLISQGETERWREDFPFKTEIEEYVTRRDFLRLLVIVSVGLAFGNTIIGLLSLGPKSSGLPKLDLGSVDGIAPGSSRVFSYPTSDVPAILIRRANGEYIAFHQKCPHLACPVTYHPEDGESLRCHCHNGAFDLRTGQGIQGPPRELRPLKEVVLKVEHGNLFAVGLS